MLVRYYATLIPVALLLVVSACFVSVTALELSDTSALLLWYLVCVVAIVTLCGLVYKLRLRTPHLIARIAILGSFLYWALTIYLQTHQTDVPLAYFGALLEASALLSFALVVCFYIYTTFAKPSRIHFRLLAALSVLLLPVLLLSHTALNYSIATTRGVAVLTPNFIHTYSVLLAGALLLIAVIMIPRGKRVYPVAKSRSVSDLTFKTLPDLQDCNLPLLLSHVVEEARRHALKRGQWISYRPELFTAKGVIETKKFRLETLLHTLLDFALHTTPDNAVSISVLPDTNSNVVHVSISHTTTTAPALPHATFKAEIAEIGGAVTLETKDTTTTYVISFPIHL